MQTIQLTYPHSLKTEDLPEIVAAIGFFDGIHKGHQKVIETAINIAAQQGQESAVITFFPHPSVVLKKDQKQVKYLTPLHEKQQILQEMGVDKLYVIAFNDELANLSPQAFIDHFIIGLQVQHLVAGYDFSYGHKGRGSMETIDSHARNKFAYTTIDKVEKDNNKISSTLIREYLREGKVQKANDLLGRPMVARGTVVEGEKRGRTIGYPTANIKLSDDFFMPKVGVYAVTAQLGDKKLYGMANLGYNPTFQDNITEPRIEVNLFDYNEAIYGEELTIEWQSFIRDEYKFNGVDELIGQMKQDEKHIREFFIL